MIIVDEIYEYDYDVQDDVHTLRYSNNGGWTHPKEIAMQLVDDGNGLVIKFNEKGRIDYGEAEQLLILLKIINRSTKYEIVTKKELL